MERPEIDDFDSTEPTEREHQEFMEYQIMLTEQIKVLKECYGTFADSETIQKKCKNKIVELIDLL